MKPWHQKDLLIFDFDGTLVNTNHLHHQAFLEVLKPWNAHFDFQDIHGLKSKDALQKILNQKGIDLKAKEIEELTYQKQQLVRELIAKNLDISPEVYNFLVHAHQKHQLAIVSAGASKTVSKTLENLKILNLFKLIICAEDVSYTKPHPEGFLLALKMLNVQPSFSLIFEDSEVGFMAAKAALVEYIDVNDFDWRY